MNNRYKGQVYGVQCPVTQAIVYVGATKKGVKNRMASHWRESRRDRSYNTPFIAWLRLLPEMPNVVVLEDNIPLKYLSSMERYHISIRASQLLNVCWNPES